MNSQESLSLAIQTFPPALRIAAHAHPERFQLWKVPALKQEVVPIGGTFVFALLGLPEKAWSSLATTFPLAWMGKKEV